MDGLRPVPFLAQMLPIGPFDRGPGPLRGASANCRFSPGENFCRRSPILVEIRTENAIDS
jgi:hypothetical protein